MKRKKLILLTSEFPYGNGEPFLETEIVFLANRFDDVLIYSGAISNDSQRDLPKNVSCKQFSNQLSKFDKLKAILGIFSKEFRSEKKRVTEIYESEWSKGIRNTALISLFVGKRWKKALDKEVRNSRDADLTFYSYWCTDTAIGISLLKQVHPSIKSYSRTHGWDLYFEATSFNYQPFRELIAKNLTGLFPISEMGKKYISQIWKVESKSIQVARLGTRKSEGNNHESTRNILVSCSNLVPLKRVSLIAESLKFIDNVELEWFHFGDGPERSSVEEFAEIAGRGGVKFQLMGRKTNREILDWYEQTGPSLFVNVSTTEGIPVSIMEAMSFGIPVLATNVGGTSEIVNESNGELLPAELTAEELGSRIKVFFELPKSEQDKKRQFAKETWETKFNAETNYKSFVNELLK